MHKSHGVSGDESMKKEYKIYCNKLSKNKAITKKFHYDNELKKHASDPRKTWELLQTLSPQLYLNV